MLQFYDGLGAPFEPELEMKKKFVTSAQVAERAGVSRSAVSRTFTPGAYVSPEVREKVLLAADEMGYRINRLAKSLPTSESSLVAILASNLSEPFIAALIDALSATLADREMQTLLLNSGARRDMAAMMNLVLEYRVKAVVILSGAPPERLVEQCLKSQQRTILINRESATGIADTIQTDDREGGRLAARHLIEGGYRRLAVVRGASNTPSQRRRAEGFIEAAAREGLAVRHWLGGEGGYESGCAAARELLKNSEVDGVFCTTDRIGLGFLNTCRFNLGLDVPHEIGIVGFDDIEEAGWPSHGLTTIRQAVGAMVDAVVAILASDARGILGQTHIVPVELVARQTTRS